MATTSCWAALTFRSLLQLPSDVTEDLFTDDLAILLGLSFSGLCNSSWTCWPTLGSLTVHMRCYIYPKHPPSEVCVVSPGSRPPEGPLDSYLLPCYTLVLLPIKWDVKRTVEEPGQ